MTDDEKRQLLKEHKQAERAYVQCAPGDPSGIALMQLYLELDRRCREVFGTIPAKV